MQRSLVGYRPWRARGGGEQESDMTERLTLSLFFFSTFKETILLLFEDPVLSSPEAIVDLHNIHFINYYHFPN